ncbi:hypothetical protein D3C78_976300 [compost metagenome]
MLPGLQIKRRSKSEILPSKIRASILSQQAYRICPALPAMAHNFTAFTRAILLDFVQQLRAWRLSSFFLVPAARCYNQRHNIVHECPLISYYSGYL